MRSAISSPELKELEDTILGAEDKLYALEYQLYCEVRDKIGAEVLRIQKTARASGGDRMCSPPCPWWRSGNNYVQPAHQ